MEDGALKGAEALDETLVDEVLDERQRQAKKAQAVLSPLRRPKVQNGTMIGTFEPFLDIGDRGPLGPTWYRAGYRCGTTGKVICIVELPATIAEKAIPI